MAYSVPNNSKTQINKAGQILKDDFDGDKVDPKEYFKALLVAENWRACHAYPLNTFNATLRSKLRLYPKDTLVAQRLKRMPTIIDKLRRHPSMQLTTMQDIGGIRVVVETIEEVYKVADEYRNSRFNHELYNENDHINNPRDEDGYRSLHLMYKYKNLKVTNYDGLRLELQIRTKLQHAWATAVETMGTFLGQALKSRQGDKEWLDFFATVSSAFACIEKTNVLPRHTDMTEVEIFKSVSDMEKKLGAIEKMGGFYTAANEITKQGKQKSWSYHLIILNSLEKKVEVKAYNRRDFNKALNDYAAVEEQVAKGAKIEPVLVSAGPLDMLKKAYPNFFLDITDFCKAVSDINVKVKEF